eukprot:11794189-Alexandrium_andersonii.AAC.1
MKTSGTEVCFEALRRIFRMLNTCAPSARNRFQLAPRSAKHAALAWSIRRTSFGVFWGTLRSGT